MPRSQRPDAICSLLVIWPGRIQPLLVGHKHNHAPRGAVSVAVAASRSLNDGLQRRKRAIDHRVIQIDAGLDALRCSQIARSALPRAGSDFLQNTAAVRRAKVCRQTENILRVPPLAQLPKQLSRVRAQVQDRTSGRCLQQFLRNARQRRSLGKPPVIRDALRREKPEPAAAARFPSASTKAPAARQRTAAWPWRTRRYTHTAHTEA